MKSIWSIPVLLLIATLFQFFCGCRDFNGSGELPQVKEVNLAKMDPSLFQEEEWYAPYYLAHFARLANSIADTGANRGFFRIPVWRNERDNQPYNARIMENIMTLAWFYTQERPWNIYRGDYALKKRLEAALTFWCNIQNPDGKFSEYAPEQWSLAPTAFATKFIGRALDLLNTGSDIDPKIFKRAQESLRKALLVSFSDPGFWKHGLNYTNQYSNLWGGALLYLKNWPDTEIRDLFIKRFIESMKEFQSPCGFFYEKGGPDWGYNLNTHHSDLQVAWSFADEPWMKDSLINQTERWYEWFSYNALPEPDSTFFFINRAIETRQRKGVFENNEVQDPSDARWTPQSEFIRVAQAFDLSREEYMNTCRMKYNSMKNKWPEVEPLRLGDFSSYSAYAFLHNQMEMWLPAQAMKDPAIQKLPCLSETRFTRIWHDSRSQTTYTFIRRPGYFVAFNSGKIITDQNRYGLGIVWSPTLGTIMQSQSRSSNAAWGTRKEGDENVSESDDLNALIFVNGKKFVPAEGKNNPDAADLKIEYGLGGGGTKTLVFREEEIQVIIRKPGKFIEFVPLLVSEKNVVSYNQTGIGLAKGMNSVSVELKNVRDITFETVPSDLKIKECSVFAISAQDRLEYTFKF